MSTQVYSTPESKAADAALVKGAETTQSEPVAPEAAEQKTSLATDAEETEASESEGDESESDEDDGESLESKSDSDKDKPKKKSGAQRRKERAERAEAEVTRLQKLVEEMALKGAGDSKKQEPVKAEAAPAEGEPDPDQFETHKDYVKAVAKWEYKQEREAEKRDAEKAKLQEQHASMQQAHFDRLKAFAEKTADFDDVIRAVDVSNIPYSVTVEQIIMSSENGPELMYELAKNRDEFARICNLKPVEAARELGKFEARLIKASETPKQEPKKLTTKAPAPIAPVGGKGGPVRKNLNDPNLSYKDHEAIRLEQMANRKSSW